MTVLRQTGVFLVKNFGNWIGPMTAAILFSLPAFNVLADKQILKLEQVTDNVYAIIGPLTNRTPENLGNNASFGFVITTEGVILIDPGGSDQGAGMIHEMIVSVTKEPIRYVINTGGQDHRWLGNGYFKNLGATIVASSLAVEDQKSRTEEQLAGLERLIGEAGLEGTEPVHADKVFEDSFSLSLGNTRLELIHAGHAHTPGDIVVWLKDEGIVFSGDIVYIDRMLRVGSHSVSSSWLQAFEAMAALNPGFIIPGHGPVTNLEKAGRDTRGYLEFIRSAVQTFMDQGGGIEDISSIDQSQFSYLKNFDELKGRNAQQVFQELEFE